MAGLDFIKNDLLVGVFLVVAAAIFLMSGLGWLFGGDPFFAPDIDIIIAFVLLLIGTYELFYKGE
ncbi:MAG: hypothetical protein ABIA76_00565 [Candidatus Diapherotrites archaeon]